MSWFRGLDFNFENLPWMTKADYIAGIIGLIGLGIAFTYYFGKWVWKRMK
jgi:hypothetical protein